MAKAVLPRIVVDTCVILDLLTAQDTDHMARAKWLLDRHDVDHRILLPAIVIAEVGGTGGAGGDDGGAGARALRLKTVRDWLATSTYQVADLTERIARHAAQLSGDYRLKGADATILATSLAWSCTHLYTRDNSLLGVDDNLPGITITEPEDPPEPTLDMYLTQNASDDPPS